MDHTIASEGFLENETQHIRANTTNIYKIFVPIYFTDVMHGSLLKLAERGVRCEVGLSQGAAPPR